MTPNYFRFVKKAGEAGPSTAFQYTFTNNSGFTEVLQPSYPSAPLYFSTMTINSVADVPYAGVVNGQDGNGDWGGAVVGDFSGSAIDSTIDGDAFTVTGWYQQSNGNASGFFFDIAGVSQYALELEWDHKLKWHQGGSETTIHTFASNATHEAMHHYAVAVDKTAQTVKIYLDGSLTNSSSISTSELTNFSNRSSGDALRVFGSESTNIQSAQGAKLADLRLYSSALSASEVSDVIDDL